MPYAASKPCTFAGCGTLTTNGSRCIKHPYEKTRSKSVSAYKYLYNSKNWKVGRLNYLAKHPLCVECESKGIVEAATVVDHKKAHNGDLKLFYNRQNWWALCKRCHDRKTASVDGGFGNRKK